MMKISTSFLLFPLCIFHLTLMGKAQECQHLHGPVPIATGGYGGNLNGDYWMKEGIDIKYYTQSSRINRRRSVAVTDLEWIDKDSPCVAEVKISYKLNRRRLRDKHYTAYAKVQYKFDSDTRPTWFDIESCCITDVAWTKGSSSYFSRARSIMLAEPCMFTRHRSLRGENLIAGANETGIELDHQVFDDGFEDDVDDDDDEADDDESQATDFEEEVGGEIE